MSLSSPFIQRPVATTLITIGITIAGMLAFFKLPVAPLPQVDFPTISVSAQLPGASPETVATSLAEPLERALGIIADVTEMTSQNSLGQTRITLQFGLDRDINGAARDVEAAINAARALLPTNLPNNPTYRQVNPADAPIMVLALTSDTLSIGQVFDAASNVLQQRLSQIEGVGQVVVGGSTLPAVRVELNPNALFHYGIGLEDIHAAIGSANADSPKGTINQGNERFQIYTNDQATKAADYSPLVVAYRNGAAVRLSELGEVNDSVQDLRNAGLANGKPAALVILWRLPGANIIDTVDRVRGSMKSLAAAMPSGVDMVVSLDRSPTIRASLHDTEQTLIISVVLVTFIVFLFLGNLRAALIPAVAVPVSIIGTFGAMYLLNFSLDILSLMALTIATGFVVDDAIVVLENISRHLENGMSRLEAALLGAREVGFTVLSMSLSLVAVFTPILLMQGILGRLFREFALTLSLAIFISLIVSLTTTPMMCALVLKQHVAHPGRPRRPGLFERIAVGYGHSLDWALRHSFLTLLALIGTIALTGYLYVQIPKGFFPQEDTGRLTGTIQADQAISFQAMKSKLTQFLDIVRKNENVVNVMGFTGVGSGGGPSSATNTATVFVTLKPLSQRTASADVVIGQLRQQTAGIAGARLYFQVAQDLRTGGRSSNAQYQYTLQSDNTTELYEWSPKIMEALQKSRLLADVNSDQQQGGRQGYIEVDRDTAARLGLDSNMIDNNLYDAFGQRQVTTIFSAINQYHVIMEIDPRYLQSPESLRSFYLSTSGGNTAAGSATSNATPGTVTGLAASTLTTSSSTTASQSAAVLNAASNALANTGTSATSSGAPVSTTQETMVPLLALMKYQPRLAPISINHQGLFVATTISFNLPPSVALGDASDEIDRIMKELNVPAGIHGSLQGTAALLQKSLANEPLLVLAALIAVYIVLGVLYESYIHPITILSTLPSAGVGALLALLACNTEFSIIAMIGVILLIGIVKKNAIMMIDFAIDAERHQGLGAREAILQASVLRFRPIMMTTAAAIFGAIPLVISSGDGAEIRRPLGIAIVGGLVVSQILTLYTTPVLYLYFDRLGGLFRRRGSRPAGPIREPSATEV
jgi:multidrug efflux pump